MKKIILLTSLLFVLIANAQESYYNDVDLTAEGLKLKQNLATKTISAHTNILSYGWGALQATDLNPANSSEVLLIYGYSATGSTSRTRNANQNGGGQGDWNREHVYPKSLGTPNLGEAGPGADAHHLRPSDVDFNSLRGNTKFADGSGDAGDQNGGWYPGDEWKGDVARIMMYMYIHYGDQCKPTGVGIGNNANAGDDMIDLFLEWNVEDPVSDFERQRNNYHENTNNTYAQGNRNPFIDNAYLATRIWGGNDALDSWGLYITSDSEAPTTPTNVSLSNITTTTIDVSWNASSDNVAVTKYEIYVDGSLHGNSTNTNYTITNLNSGTNYSITVLAKDIASNKSAQSTAVNGTTLTDNAAPSVPTNITITNETGTSFIVNWNASTDDSSVASYDIFLNGNLEGTSTTTTYTAIGLNSNTTYSVSVLARDIANNVSDKSSAINATTTAPTSTCGAETFENMPANSGSYSNLTWTGDDGIEWNAVKSRTDQTLNGRAIAIALLRDNVVGSMTSSTFANGMGSLTASTMRVFTGGSGNLNVLVNGNIVGTLPYDTEQKTTTISNINVSGNVSIEIRRAGSEADRVIIDDLTWTCYSTLSTIDESLETFKMYPNPVNGNTIYFNTNKNISVQIFTILGQLVKSAKITESNNSIDISSLSKDVYVVKMNIDNAIISKKLIKN
ncbi:endonuclease [uncultured Polaribacter sp.]|uniref:endonuclease n=1 Tax=uncultured Polaribacter sp. TaxID=174711 RepID=UPI0030D920EC|tara:strand:- start:2259 stop:4286 length:2028 start_codon:yes stop_codon:yes gene_type:complete